MKKIIYFVLAFTFLITSFTPVAYADSSNVNIKERSIKQSQKLIDKNDKVKAYLEQLEQSGYDIDSKVKAVQGEYFITFSKQDANGFIHFKNNDYLVIEVKEESGVQTATVTDANGYSTNFEFNNDYSIKTVTTSGQANEIGTMALSPRVCSILVNLAGAGISTIYTAVATAIGGPVAAIIVNMITTVGWTYVSEGCNK